MSSILAIGRHLGVTTSCLVILGIMGPGHAETSDLIQQPSATLEAEPEATTTPEPLNISHPDQSPGPTPASLPIDYKDLDNNQAKHLVPLEPDQAQLPAEQQPSPASEPAASDPPIPSPLARPATRLVGFETAETLRRFELILHGGITSYDSPDNLQPDNRDNDFQAGLDFGVTDRFQFSVGVYGKDETQYANLVRTPSSLQFQFGGVPVQAKYQFYQGKRLKAAVVLGAEFPATAFVTTPGGEVAPAVEAFSNGSDSRLIILTTDPGGILAAENALVAADDSVFVSLAAPITYQPLDRLRLTLNPQVSFLPETIPVINTRGNVAALQAAGIGYDGDRLDYFGSIVGLGFGLDYSLNSRVRLTADITPILAGRNAADSGGEDSLFVQKVVWNAGLQVALQNQLGLNLYATNRFSAITAAPSNLLVQPGGNWGVGFDLSYLPDTDRYEVKQRSSYPRAEAFFSGLSGFPATTLPIGSIIYQLASGTQNRLDATIRAGLLDDLELVVSRSNLDLPQIPIQYFVQPRLALLPDRGTNHWVAAIGTGFTLNPANDGRGSLAGVGFFDLPISYKFRQVGLSLTATPKIAYFFEPLGCDICDDVVRGDRTLFGLTLGVSFNLTRRTQFLAEATPILVGDNQLQNNGLDGKSLLYGVGLRQLFPAGNSVYAVDLYVRNSAGDAGLQGIVSLPNDEIQVGVRLNVLNGVPVR